MTISRTNMGSQLKGDKMAYKAKKTKKKIVGGILTAAEGSPRAQDLLGSLSPLYGALAGKGMFGRLAGTSKSAASAGSKKAQQAVETPVMKNGGRVRGDGVAQRGKTRGKIC